MSKHRVVHVGRGATLRLRGRCWHLDYNFKGQRSKRSLYTSSRQEAEIIARELITDSESRAWGVVIPRDVLFSDFFQDYKEYSKLHHAPKTQTLNWGAIERFQQFMTQRRRMKRPLILADVTQNDVEAFQATEAAKTREIGRYKKIRKTRNATVNIYLRVVSAFFEMAMQKKLLRVNPAAAVKPLPKEDGGPRILDPEQVVALLSEASKQVVLHGPEGKGEFLRPRMTPLYEFVCLLLNTGLRLGEALFLEWSDVDRKRKVLHVPFTEEYKPKDRERRAVGLNEAAFSTLGKLYLARRQDVRWVFANEEDKRFESRNILREFKRIASRAGVRWANFKTLRATFATNAAEVMPPFKLQRILGHSSVKTTEQYYIHLRGRGDWIPPVVGA